MREAFLLLACLAGTRGYNPSAGFARERNAMNEDMPVEEETSGLSQIERVANVFVAPAATFRDILRSTSWWLPFVLLVASTIGTAFMVDRKVGFDQAYQNQVHASQKLQDRMASLTPQQQAQGKIGRAHV